MNLNTLEKDLGIVFSDKKLLKESLTHRSYLNEHREENLHSNERLEFLGDAVLELVVSRLLFLHFPEAPEGFLTACRSQIVQTRALASLALELNLGDYLLLSKGEEEGGGRKNPGLLENAFEALVGAVYLDCGIEISDSFLTKLFTPVIAALEPENLKDAKSLLQEKTQEKEKITPTYKVVDQSGPEHAKTFTVAVYVGARQLAEGKGRSKQEAEEEAARLALEKVFKN